MKGRVALVSGAASGMGKAVAQALLLRGASVVGFSLEESCSIIHDNFTYVCGRVDRVEDCEKAVQVTIDKHSKLDCVVNCAGIVAEGNLESTSVDEFKKVMDVNVVGTFNVCKSAIPYLKKQPSTIVNISSDMSKRAIADRVAYNPSKAAVNMLSKCIAVDYAPHVRCNTILPGIVNTPMIQQRIDKSEDAEALKNWYNSLYPMQRIGSVEDIVNGVLFLSSDASSWMTGSELAISGGSLV